VLDKAQKTPTTQQEIAAQFGKLGDTDFVMNECKVSAQNVFIPKSLLNNFRRECIQQLQEKIIKNNEQSIHVQTDETELRGIQSGIVPSIQKTKITQDIVVVNEDNISAIDQDKLTPNNYIIALSPRDLSLTIIDKMAKQLKGFALALNLPIMANHEDLKVVDAILNKHPDFYLIANNIYGLYYAQTHKVIAGWGMNIFSDYAVQFLLGFGCVGCVLSFEQKLNKINQDNVHIYSLGYVPLMTFAHCPYKTVWGNDCANCKYTQDLTYTDVHNNTFIVRRIRISQCYFELLHHALINNIGCHNAKHFIDLRELNPEQINIVLCDFPSNKKFKLTSKDTIGKINSAVK